MIKTRITEKKIMKCKVLYDKINKYPLNLNIKIFTQKYYNYINNLNNIPICKNCNNEVSFNINKKKYNEFCSTKCVRNNIDVNIKRNNTMEIKYNKKNYNNRNKAKNTNLKKYGVENISQINEIKLKKKKIFNEKYGVDSYTQTKNYLQKTKNTNLKKYGVESHNQNKEIKEKKKISYLKKYGVDSPLKSEIIREKIKNTNMLKYGVENVMNLHHFREKAIQTTIEKYGEIWKNHFPRYNPTSIDFFDEITKRTGIFIQHALNNGEKKFIKYWVDGYIEKYNICIEWDEIEHKYGKSKLRNKIKEDFLINNFNINLFRINEIDYFNNNELVIQTTVDMINKKIF